MILSVFEEHCVGATVELNGRRSSLRRGCKCMIHTLSCCFTASRAAFIHPHVCGVTVTAEKCQQRQKKKKKIIHDFCRIRIDSTFPAARSSSVSYRITGLCGVCVTCVILSSVTSSRTFLCFRAEITSTLDSSLSRHAQSVFCLNVADM